jgi:hypothetical protein
MEKTAEDDGPVPTFVDHREEYESLKGRLPGHHNFGQRVSLGTSYLSHEILIGVVFRATEASSQSS